MSIRTPYTLTNLHAGALDTASSEGRQVRSFQLAAKRVRDRPDIAAALIHKPGPLNNWPDNLSELAEVYRRGMAEVDALVRTVIARPT